MLPVRRLIVPVFSGRHRLDLAKMTGGELRRAPDGWHAIVPLGGAIHRLWLHELPAGDSLLAVDLPLDANFDIRSQAAHRFWLALEQRPLGSPPLPLPFQRRRRLILAVRALDGWLEGNSYREIAAGLFGQTSRPGSRLEISRFARPYHPLSQERHRTDAGRLSRPFAFATSEKIDVRPGVSKIDPLIFGIPLRGPSPSLSPSTRH